MQRWGGAVSVVKNEDVQESGKEMGQISRFLV